MAFKNRNGILATVLVVLVAAELLGGAWAATYVVGDGLGWTVPPSPTAYFNWASQHVFVVGDVFVFNFTAGFHDVARVTGGAYAGCSSTSPIALATLGPASFTLNSTGPDYYICTFGQHCSLGQRLAINVTSSSSLPPPAPAPIPASTPPSSAPPPAATTTPTPSVVPSPTPSVVPSPTPSSSPMPSPESAPSPTPAGSGIAPSPSSGGALSPGAGPPGPSSGSAGDLTPPPPGSFAKKTPVFTPLAVIALLAVGLVM